MTTLHCHWAKPLCGKPLSGWFMLSLTLSFAAIQPRQCSAQLCAQLNGTNVTQNFNSLVASGSGNITSLPSFFSASESGTGSNLTYSADNGAASTANTYSYGSGSASDRALGELTSTTFQSTIGACFVNNTNHVITSFLIGYTGEQWRLGAADANFDRLDFQYSTNAGSISSGTYIDVDELDFVAPATGSVGTKDGNAAANRTVFAPFAITPSAGIQPEQTFYIRWQPDDLNGAANDGLAIDDFSIGTALAPGLAGDYNNNDQVDGADYVIFRNNFNQSVTIPNDITPGTVGSQDFNEWRQRYGTINAPGSGASFAASVPEPRMFGLWALSWGGALICGGRTRNCRHLARNGRWRA
jgi:hypothetical protein